MHPLTLILVIMAATILAPFVLRLYRRPLVWITLAIVNVIILFVFIVVRDTWHPELRADVSTVASK